MNQLVFIKNQDVVTDSQTVAKSFGKRHNDVLRDIRNMECSPEFNQRNFAQIDYTDDQNRKYPKYMIKQDGFAFLVMGYTGKEAARFKELYINEFNRMKQQLNKPMTVEEMIIAQAESVREVKQEVADIKQVVDNEVWVNERMKKQIQDTVSRRVFALRRQGHEAHFQTIYSALKRYYGVSKYDKIPRKDFDEAIQYIDGWFPREKKKSQLV
ncbi:phage Rha protein [Geomicrobium sp. JCM 19037]|uniref:Rha family transcriptional regulator n=1 Tax=Geomicrobium sp. JCM 19037 TaxID=1460634 RepID=UPI00045F2A86|nr:Rha family transcriptional regulator [Geomicrobium sp. JCM 19037]GAK05196.1 phage Rha protein [Geomicrobium sp. JCM 19037]